MSKRGVALRVDGARRNIEREKEKRKKEGGKGGKKGRRERGRRERKGGRRMRRKKGEGKETQCAADWVGRGPESLWRGSAETCWPV